MRNLLSWGAVIGASFLIGCATSAPSADEQELQATMQEHGQDKPVASPAAALDPAQPVSGEAVSYTTADGRAIEGWLARPDNMDGPLPALLVIHEWWGLNDNVRRAAERLAGEGYVTLAVDLHQGATAATPKEAMQMAEALAGNQDASVANMGDAIEYLQTEIQPPAIGVIGWCQGGRWSLLTAQNFPDAIDAAVVYYGRVTADQDELQVLDMPVLGIFAGEDFIVPPESAYTFAAAMAALDKDLEFHMYREAAHAFANPSGTEYNPEAAADAWQHTTEFLSRSLAGEAETP